MSFVRTLRTASRTLASRPVFQTTLRTPAFAQIRTMASTSNFLEAIKKRRTYYAISNKSTVSDARIEEIVKDIVLHVPSSFNSQSSRVVVLFKAEHEKLWDITSEVLKPIVPEAQWATTEKKLGSFKAGYGTVLFFEDQAPVRELQKNFPLYQENFPVWSEVRAPAPPPPRDLTCALLQHTSGMIQFATWTALEQEGLGASLQVSRSARPRVTQH